MSKSKEKGDVELASAAGREDDETTDSEEEDEVEDNVPFFVFLWTYKPWQLYGHLIPLFITHTIVICAVGVFMCNSGYGDIACSPVGLVGFLIGVMGLAKIQMYGDLKKTSEKMQEELNKMKRLMGKYETENKKLKDTMKELEAQSDALKAESNKLERFNQNLKTSTEEFEEGVQQFRRERMELNQSFLTIKKIVGTLEDKEVDLHKRCMSLKKELKKLRAHNHTIVHTYNNLVAEHEGVRQTNKKLSGQIKKFEEMRQKFIDQRDVLKQSMKGNLNGLHSMMCNYEIMFLQEIAHNAEFIDGVPGMTKDKFEDFIRRIPTSMGVSEDKLLQLFHEMSDENGICDHESVNHIISEINKVNVGVPGDLNGELDEDLKLESAKVDL